MTKTLPDWVKEFEKIEQELLQERVNNDKPTSDMEKGRI